MGNWSYNPTYSSYFGGIKTTIKLPILEESNLMQMYGSFDGFIFNSALFGLVI